MRFAYCALRTDIRTYRIEVDDPRAYRL
jgi:hypothetical protein